MRALLASLVAGAVLLPAPAAAIDPDSMSFSQSHGVTIHSNFGGDRHDRRRHGHDDNIVPYEYYREYQGDTAWKSDGFNDWWHDRPDRAYPRWMASNQNCDRMWWGGGTWRC